MVKRDAELPVTKAIIPRDIGIKSKTKTVVSIIPIVMHTMP